MKKLDIYIMRKFLGSFLFILGMFVVITMVTDVSERLDDFLESDAGFWAIIFRNYLPFTLYMGKLLSPFLVFLAVIWVTSRMAQQSELVAILSSGVSFNRMLRPFLIAGSVVAMIFLIGSHFVIPITNRIKFDFDRKYIFGDHNFGRDIYREIQPRNIYYFDWIDESKRLGYHFTKETWEGTELREKIIANRAKLSEDSTSWKLIDGQIRSIQADGAENIRDFGTLDTTLNMKLENFGRPDEVFRNQVTPKLYEFRQKELDSGAQTVSKIDIEIHTRTTRAFSIVILTFIGATIASRKRRGGLGVSLLFAIVAAAIFQFTERMAQVAATNIGLHVLIAVWIPNIVFSAFAMFLYWRAPK